MHLNLSQCGRRVAATPFRFTSFVATVAAALSLAVLPLLAQETPLQPQKADPALKYVPGDAHIVFSFNPGQLLKKSGYETLADLPGTKEALKEIRQNSEIAAKLIEAPELLGIDFNRPIHVFLKVLPPGKEFGQPSVSGGLIATPLSAKKIQEGLRNVLKEAAGEVGLAILKKMRVEEGWNILESEETKGAGSLAFNDEVVILVGTDPSREDSPKAEKISESVRAAKNPLSKTEPAFVAYLKKNADAGGWMNLNSMLELAPDMKEEQLKKMRQMLGNLRMAGTVNFSSGSVRADLLYNTDAAWWKNMMKAGPKKTMLDLIPQRAVASGVYSFDMEASRKWMKDEYLPMLKNLGGAEGQQGFAFAELMVMGATGLKLEELLDIPKGEMMFTFVDLKKAGENGEPKPSLLFGMTVNDEEKLGKLINKLKQGEGEGVLKAMNDAGFDLLQQKGRFFLGSDNLINAVKLGRMPGAVEGAQRGFYDKNDMALAVDFGIITRLAQDFDAPDEAVKILQKFARFEATANMKPDHLDYGIELIFRNKEKNALRQIVDMIQEATGNGDAPRPGTKRILPPLPPGEPKRERFEKN